MTRNYEVALGNENVRAFLSLIRKTEGAGYSTLFGGGTFNGWADHPRQKITKPLGGRSLTSTAAGAYQFLARTWDECAASCGLKDFSPASQDIAAIFLIDRREALEDVIDGDWRIAIAKCNKEWASLPGSPYGQPTKPLDYCLAYLDRFQTPAAAAGVVRRAAETVQAAVAPQMGVAAVIDDAWKTASTQSAQPAPSRLFSIPAFLRVLKAGEELASAVKVKNVQGTASSLAALVLAIAAVARGYGYALPITDDQLSSLVTLAAVFLLNAWTTFATSKRVGMSGAAASQPSGVVDGRTDGGVSGGEPVDGPTGGSSGRMQDMTHW